MTPFLKIIGLFLLISLKGMCFQPDNIPHYGQLSKDAPNFQLQSSPLRTTNSNHFTALENESQRSQIGRDRDQRSRDDIEEKTAKDLMAGHLSSVDDVLAILNFDEPVKKDKSPGTPYSSLLDKKIKKHNRPKNREKTQLLEAGKADEYTNFSSSLPADIAENVPVSSSGSVLTGNSHSGSGLANSNGNSKARNVQKLIPDPLMDTHKKNLDIYPTPMVSREPHSPLIQDQVLIGGENQHFGTIQFPKTFTAEKIARPSEIMLETEKDSDLTRLGSLEQLDGETIDRALPEKVKIFRKETQSFRHPDHISHAVVDLSNVQENEAGKDVKYTKSTASKKRKRKQITQSKAGIVRDTRESLNKGQKASEEMVFDPGMPLKLSDRSIVHAISKCSKEEDVIPGALHEEISTWFQEMKQSILTDVSRKLDAIVYSRSYQTRMEFYEESHRKVEGN
ncbi:hypothetical protein CROQUDRAFT_93399 [Cronartium quercuum f. sp. fusiforme G11]|uniref:Uncharacterized protein n=1 Tax=Cronartium quercuum f. sp. fusiforme G11 TaxID=708437 RepID=A0A9P6TCN1_9BASI|nr:hypothetical protein CROQUDRAFT_93399 [Cronartium quercuum f. sp. fusiforme G11]